MHFRECQVYVESCCQVILQDFGLVYVCAADNGYWYCIPGKKAIKRFLEPIEPSSPCDSGGYLTKHTYCDGFEYSYPIMSEIMLGLVVNEYLRI